VLEWCLMSDVLEAISSTAFKERHWHACYPLVGSLGCDTTVVDLRAAGAVQRKERYLTRSRSEPCTLMISSMKYRYCVCGSRDARCDTTGIHVLAEFCKSLLRPHRRLCCSAL
jgi:hypothetical protein